MSDLFIDNKYTHTYYQIINRAKSRTILEGYSEKHHIIPKSLGGLNDADNIVALTAREHFICHHLLTKMTTGKSKAKMITAARFMTLGHSKKQKRYSNSRLYESIKKQYNEQQKGHPHLGPFTQSEESNRSRSEKLKKRYKNQKHHNLGMKWTDEQKQKLKDAKAKSDYVWTEEHKSKIAEANRINGLKKRGRIPHKTECCGRMWDAGNLAQHKKRCHPTPDLQIHQTQNHESQEQ